MLDLISFVVDRKEIMDSCSLWNRALMIVSRAWRWAGRGTLVLAILLAAMDRSEASTIIRMNTVMGLMDVRLYDTATPITTANFLNYTSSGRYNGTFVHRSAKTQLGEGFVIQGGGYVLNNSIFAATPIQTNPAIMNEPGISNIRGTVAMAKLGSDPNSATSQWFINLGDNSFLDLPENNAFTVFGRVLGDGMAVADAIAALGRINAGYSPFNEVPVLDVQTVLNQGDIRDSDAVIVQSVAVRNIPEGDYDFDLDTDGADFLLWQVHYRSTTQAESDGNGNGIVDSADLTIWRNDFGTAAGLAGIAAANTVPEPGTWLLAVLLCSLCYVGASRRSRGRG